MHLISVIIPIYNIEEYLARCLNSVLSQTYQNLEIILINDGSTDCSGEICNQFAAVDNRIKVIHQENAGLAEARNVGTDSAHGDYLFYLDSDDYLDSECIEKLMKIAKDNDADVVQSNFYYDYSEYLLYHNKIKKIYVSYSCAEALDELIKQEEIKNFAWGKLIRTDIAKLYPFPKGKYFEDTLWMYQIIKAVRKYIISSEPLVYYFQRKNSISASFSMRNLDQLELYAQRLRLIKKQDATEVYVKALFYFNELLLQHQYILKNTSIDFERSAYQEKIDGYTHEFELKKHFGFRYIISNSRILSFFKSVFVKIKSRMSTKSYWEIIKK